VSRDIALIAEVKKASHPQVYLQGFDRCALQGIRDGGASCLSVLTDGKFFKVRSIIPANRQGEAALLAKIFIINERQILESSNGADAILLIVAILSDEQLANSIHRDGSRLAALVEVHDEANWSALKNQPSTHWYQ